MFTLGADALAPQVGSGLLLLLFYLTDFQVVGYIPKPAFSSMLVLAFMDMVNTWFYKSFFKTKDKMEWIVVPVSDAAIISRRANLHTIPNAMNSQSEFFFTVSFHCISKRLLWFVHLPSTCLRLSFLALHSRHLSLYMLSSGVGL